MKKSISLVLLILTLFTLSACKKEASMPEKGDPITFKAMVLSVETDLESIFVEAEDQEFTKAVISLHSDTELTDSEGNPLEISDIEKDDIVTITNFGLMTDDYPVQMSAQKIVLEKAE